MTNIDLSPQVNRIISAFRDINPGINYAHRGNRQSADWLIKNLGEERTLYILQVYKQVMLEPFAPSIQTPRDLKEKLGRLQQFLHQRQAQLNKNQITTI